MRLSATSRTTNISAITNLLLLRLRAYPGEYEVCTDPILQLLTSYDNEEVHALLEDACDQWDVMMQQRYSQETKDVA